MEIKETVISRIYENKFREFFVTLKIKPTDITLDEREACRAACEQGTLMKGQLERFQAEEEIYENQAQTNYTLPRINPGENGLGMPINKNEKMASMIDLNLLASIGQKSPEKPEETIYQKFKRTCIDYSGEDYYKRLKKHLGVEHLRDLEAKHSESMIEDLFKCQTWVIEDRKLGLKTNSPQWVVAGLTHKHNAYNLWLELFESFNNPK